MFDSEKSNVIGLMVTTYIPKVAPEREKIITYKIRKDQTRAATSATLNGSFIITIIATHFDAWTFCCRDLVYYDNSQHFDAWPSDVLLYKLT